MLADLQLAATAFGRTTPDALARTIGDLVRRGTTQLRQQRAALMRPLVAGLPELSDLADGAPSLAAMMPEIPDFTEPAAAPEPADSGSFPLGRTPPPVRRPRPSDDDDLPNSWLRDDQ